VKKGKFINFCCICAFLLCLAQIPLAAQSNWLIDELLKEEQATFGKSAYLCLMAAKLIPNWAGVNEAMAYLKQADYGGSKMRYCLIIVLLFAAASVFAIDFGGTIENETALSLGEGEIFKQNNRVSVWLQLDFTDALAFNMQASYIFTLQDMLMYEVDAFALQGEFPILGETPFMLKLNLGRFPLADFSGFVLDHLVDGLEFVYSNSFMDVRIAGGYTGFLFKKTSVVIMTKADSNDIADDDNFFAAPRVIGIAELNFPELFLRQNLTLSALVQFDMRPEDDLIQAGETTEDPTRGGHLHSQYFGLGIGGTILPSFYYNLFGYVQIGETLSWTGAEYEYAPILAFASGGRLSWFLRDSVASMFGFEVLFASGDNDTDMFLEGSSEGESNIFIPVTKTELGIAFTPQLPNIFLVSIEYSMKPMDSMKDSMWSNLQTALKCTAFFRASTGHISDYVIDMGSDSLILGGEVDLVTRFRPFSDLGLVLNVGLFIPATSDSFGAMPAGSNLNFVSSFEFSFSF